MLLAAMNVKAKGFRFQYSEVTFALGCPVGNMHSQFYQCNISILARNSELTPARYASIWCYF